MKIDFDYLYNLTSTNFYKVNDKNVKPEKPDTENKFLYSIWVWGQNNTRY